MPTTSIDSSMPVAPDAPLRLAVAAQIAFPHGGITAKGLRKEAMRGKLQVWRMAGKDYTTLNAIKDMQTKCLLEKTPGCGSSQKETSGISNMDQSALALAAARETAKALRESCSNTSQKASGPRETGRVIHLKSKSPTS